MLNGKDFFTKTFEEGYDENVEQVIDDIPNSDVKPTEVEISTEVVEEPKVDIPDVVVDKFNIDGEEVTIDQIKEWKQNGLRQSDYTKKTQELASQRRELEALNIEVPEKDTLSATSRLEKIERELASKELDLEISSFKSKYPDFDEVKVLTEAEKRGVYDLEFVYKALRDIDNSSSQVNIEELKTQAIEEYKTKIATEKQSNKEATSISIVSSAPGQAIVDYSDELNGSEKEYCKKRGWSYQDYVEMKAKQY
jgi:hypothetical protein